jgi:MFS family permease
MNENATTDRNRNTTRGRRRRGPEGDPVRRTMRLSIYEGSATQIFLTWTTGAVLIGYLLQFGATPTEIALVGSVPLLAQIMSPFAAFLAGALGHRRLLTASFAILGRGSWIVAVLLPQLPIPAEARAAALVWLVLFSSVFQASTATLWSAWMGDVVPEDVRGRYFGLRTGIVGIVGTTANLGAGWFLDRVGAPLSFQVVLGVAIVSAAIGIWLYFRHYDPPSAPLEQSLGAVLREPLADPNFRKLLRFATFWQFVVLLAAPFVIPYFLDELGLTFTQVAIWSAVAAGTAFATTLLWGGVADRAGNKAVLAIGTFVAGFALPACWILAGLTGNTVFIWVSAVFDAIAWGGIGPALFNLSLVSAPREKRMSYLAMFALVTGLAGFLGGVLSGPLLTLLRPIAIDLFGGVWTGYHTLFALSGILRMQAWRLLRPVQETDAWRTRDVLRALRSGWRGTGFFWRT